MDAATASRKFQESKTFFASGDFQHSLWLLDEVDLAFPNQKNILYARGMCLKNLGRRDEAIAACENVLARFDDAKTKALLEELQREEMSASLNLSDLLPSEIQMIGTLQPQGRFSFVELPTSSAQTAPPAPPPPIPSLPGSTMLSFDEPLAFTQTATFPQDAPAPNNRRYVIPGAIIAVLLLLLIGLPILGSLMGDDEPPGVQTAATGEDAPPAPPASPGPAAGEVPVQTASVAEVPAQIGWYQSFDQGMQIAQQYGKLSFVFVTDDSEVSRQVEETVLMDPEIRRQSLEFICIRAKYDANAEPETQRPYLEYAEKPPAVQIYDTDGFLMMEMAGEELTAESVTGGMLVFTAIDRMGNYEVPTGRLIVVTVVALLMMPWPLFFTLLFSGKLPHDGLVNNYISVGGTAIIVSLRIGSLIGIARAIVMLKDIYDMSIVDLLIFAVLYAFYLLSYVVFMTLVLGHSVVEQIFAV